MPTAEQSPCPRCHAAPGTLAIGSTLSARPLGEFSLAGYQMKFSAVEVPVLTCSACALRVVGRFEDGHAVFTPPEEGTHTP